MENQFDLYMIDNNTGAPVFIETFIGTDDDLVARREVLSEQTGAFVYVSTRD